MTRAVKKEKPLLRAALIGAISIVALFEAPPFWVGGYDIIQMAAFLGLIIAIPPLLASLLRRLADLLADAAAKIPTGLKGTAAWAKSLKDFGDAVLPFSLFKQNHGLYMGCLKRGFLGFGASPIFLKPNVPMVFINGPSGSKKNVGHSDILLHTLPSSIFHIDYKEEDAPKYARPLERRGKRVRVLNFAGQFEEQIGRSDSYNYLHPVAACFERPHGGILDVAPDAEEHAHIIIPEPKQGDQNKVFRIGSRDIAAFVEQMEILVSGKEASIADVNAVVRDREKLHFYAKWAAGRLQDEDGAQVRIPLHESPWYPIQDPEHVERYAAYLAGMGSAIADAMDRTDARTFDSFLQGVVGELSSMHAATRAYDREHTSTFSFSDLKQEGHDTVVIVIPDNTREQANRKRMELLFSNLKKELVRHKNKKKPVTVILQEINNWTFPDLINFISWCRAYSITLVLYTQSLKTFADRYGDNTLAAVMAEAQYQLWLPGQREEYTLKLLETALGNTSVMVKQNSGRRKGEESGVDGYSYNEEARPLLYRDEIRALKDKAILIVRNAKPALVRIPSIAGIWPLREWQEISPFYNKKYRERVTVRLLRYAPWMPANLWNALKQGRERRAVGLSQTSETSNA